MLLEELRICGNTLRALTTRYLSTESNDRGIVKTLRIGQSAGMVKILKQIQLIRFTRGKNFRFCYKSKQDIKEVLEYMYQDASIYLDRKYQKVLEFLKPSETTKKHP